MHDLPFGVAQLSCGERRRDALPLFLHIELLKVARNFCSLVTYHTAPFSLLYLMLLHYLILLCTFLFPYLLYLITMQGERSGNNSAQDTADQRPAQRHRVGPEHFPRRQGFHVLTDSVRVLLLCAPSCAPLINLTLSLFCTSNLRSLFRSHSNSTT